MDYYVLYDMIDGRVSALNIGSTAAQDGAFHQIDWLVNAHQGLNARNWCLVRAASEEEAYGVALDFGMVRQRRILNPANSPSATRMIKSMQSYGWVDPV